jgi:hypothetical protein
MSTLRAATIADLAGTGPATLTGQTAAKAWANLNGTGTIAVRGSANVSSFTDNAAGDYTANYTAAMADANYVAHITTAANRNASDQAVSNVATNGNANATAPELYSTTQTRVRIGNTVASFANIDSTYVGLTVTR